MTVHLVNSCIGKYRSRAKLHVNHKVLFRVIATAKGVCKGLKAGILNRGSGGRGQIDVGFI
jgi:hypothetical protein